MKIPHAFMAILLVSQLLAIANVSFSGVGAGLVPLVPQVHPSLSNQTITTTTSTTSNCLIPSEADLSQVTFPPSSTHANLTGTVLPQVHNRTAVRLEQPVPQTFVIHMQFVFKMRNPDQFAKCYAAIMDPTSTDYGHFLNATTLEPYVPTPGEKSSVISYLRSTGLTVTDSASPIALEISATANTVQRAFGITISFYKEGNSTYYATRSDPTLPQNVAILTQGILGLDNSTRVKTLAHPTSLLRECWGDSLSPYCAPALQVGYSLSSLINGSPKYDGTGQKVAIVIGQDEPNPQSAIDTFDSEFGLPTTTLTILCISNSQVVTCPTPQPPYGIEGDLDMESVHTMAPGAQIILVHPTDSNPIGAINYIANNHIATIVSNSYSLCADTKCTMLKDSDFTSTTRSSVDSFLANDAVQGVTILFASGDQGAKPDGSSGGLGVEFPASDPNVLSVGGTDLTLTGCGIYTCTGYGSEDGWSSSGGGYSTVEPEPSWQLANSWIGTTTGRAVPDVSMFAGSPNVWVYQTQLGWEGAYGTSLATPLWAGFLADALQVRGGGNFGNIDPLVYQLGSSGSYSSLFHDITTGGNNGYSAGTRWDPVTGWGSPIGNALASALMQEQVTTDKSTYAQGDTIHYTGSGFTAGGSTQACLSTDNDGSLLCVGEPNADSTGSVAGTMSVGTNIPAGPQKFVGKDLTTGRYSSAVQLTILPQPPGVTFYVTPTGSISACGGTFSDGQSSTGCGGSFSATYNLPSPSSQWQFYYWSWSGGVTCNSISANPTSCTVSSSGSLTVLFGAKITFYTNPTNVGAILWGGSLSTPRTNGATTFDVNYGSVNAYANVPTGYSLGGWSCSGGLSCFGSSSPTSVTFSGPGTITASFVALPFDFSVSNSGPITVTQGSSGSNTISVALISGISQSVTLSCTNGVPSNTCSFSLTSGNPPFTSSLTISTSSSTPTGSLTVTVTGSGGGVTRTTQFTLTVNPPLSYTLTVAAGSGGTTNPSPGQYQHYAGDSISVSYSITGSGYTFGGWTVSGASCSGGSTSNPCQFTMPGQAVTVTANFNPPFTYSLSNSGGIAVSPGGFASNTITATLQTGSPESISLSCTSVLPSGAKCSFNPASGTPASGNPFSSTLTISTTSSTPTGSYTVTVNGNPSATAATSFTLTVNVPLSVSLISPPSPSNGGTITSLPVTFEAQVTSGGSPVQGASVGLVLDNAAIANCSGNTDPNGYYSCSYVWTLQNGQHSWYMNAFKSGYGVSASATWSFSYVLPTTISLLTQSSVGLGSSVTLSGSIAPNPGIVQVTVSMSGDSGSTWTSFITLVTDGAGSYSTAWTPAYPGTYLLKAGWAGNSQYAGSTSPSQPLTVTGTATPNPTLLLSAPSTAIHSQSLTLSITVFNPTSTGLPASVSIQITGPNNYVSFDTVQVNVASQSYATVYYDWSVPNQTGQYTVAVGLLPPQPAATDAATIQVS
jgi:uncharacterized repeat protein (TIGR02543 family)